MAQGIDFSVIDKIAYLHFSTAEKLETEAQDQGEQVTLLPEGYTPVDSPDNPFTAPQTAAQEKTQPEPPQPQRAAPERKGEPFTDHTGGRDYNRLYRIAHEYHKKHSPPVVDRDYWRTHTPGEDDTPEAELSYWKQAAEDIGAASESGLNDPLLMDLLTALYNELEREYKALRIEAHREG